MQAVRLRTGPRGYGVINSFGAIITTGMTREQVLNTVRNGGPEPPLRLKASQGFSFLHTLFETGDAHDAHHRDERNHYALQAREEAE